MSYTYYNILYTMRRYIPQILVYIVVYTNDKPALQCSRAVLLLLYNIFIYIYMYYMYLLYYTNLSLPILWQIFCVYLNTIPLRYFCTYYMLFFWLYTSAIGTTGSAKKKLQLFQKYTYTDQRLTAEMLFFYVCKKSDKSSGFFFFLPTFDFFDFGGKVHLLPLS